MKEFLDKAVKKKKEREKQTDAKPDAQGNAASVSDVAKAEGAESDDDMLDIQDEPMASHEASPATSELKRKRTEDGGFDSPKRTRTSEDLEQAPPLPPPPPPPLEDMPTDMNLTPMDESFTPPFPEVEVPTTISSKATLTANGHLSPMQLATPPTNSATEQKARPVNGEPQ